MSAPTIRGAYDRSKDVLTMMRAANEQAHTLRDRALHNVPLPRETTEGVAHYIEQTLMAMSKLVSQLETLAGEVVFDRREGEDRRLEPRITTDRRLPDPDHNVIGSADAELPLPADFLTIGPRTDRAAEEFVADLKSNYTGRAR